MLDRIKKSLLIFMLTGIASNCFAGNVIQNVKEVKEEQTVTLIGKVIRQQGELSNGKSVVFDAFKLAKPIIIIYQGGDTFEKASENLFKLWLDKKQEADIKKFLNKQVKITGKVHYYWFGPSTFPVAAKLEVIQMDSVDLPSSNSYGNKTEDQAKKAEEVVVAWSEAHNIQDLNSFSRVFAPKVKFYGKELAANKIIDEKNRLLNKYSNFHQEIVGGISCEQKNQYPIYQCDFTKRVIYGDKQKDFPSYLVIDTSAKEPKIIIESDYITDRNLK